MPVRLRIKKVSCFYIARANPHFSAPGTTFGYDSSMPQAEEENHCRGIYD